MVLESTKSATPLIRLISQQLKYSGKRFLTQYEVMKTVMETKTMEDSQQLVVEITLGRQLLGTILNIFIPTTVLNLISYTTNFYKDEFFETVVAINLTTMLVIVTLFVSVSENLPATSYMKMMDIWLLFNLFVPFLLILIHTYMENLREDGMESNNKESISSRWNARMKTETKELPSVGWKDLKTTMKKEKINEKYKKARKFAVLGIPLFSITFVILFFGIGFAFISTNN